LVKPEVMFVGACERRKRWKGAEQREEIEEWKRRRERKEKCSR